MSSGLEYRDRERQGKRESRQQASQAQRERERQRAIERRRNCTDEQREHGGPQALATEIWGKIFAPSDQKAIV